jgi:D-glycero-D-manno-heptose 1,7-bisphosphate phosphatase
MTPPRLYIFDVDGTLRWTVRPGARYPESRDEWRLMPGVAETLRAITWGAGGARLAVASNQSGVGEGRLTDALARELIEDVLRAALGEIPAGTIVALCTCPPEVACACRKPEPGLLLQALRTSGVHPAEALFVGDLDIDRWAAERAGIPFRWAAEFFGWT